MINTIVDISEIDYEREEPGEVILDSIGKRGVAIAVQVNRKDDRYVCVDGRKRLTACAILSETDEKFRRIPIMILNDYSKAGSAFWGNTQNLH